MKRTPQFRVVIVLACLCILVIAAVSVIGPSGSTEASNVGTSLTANTRLPNFDIRTSVSDEDSAFRASVRETEQGRIDQVREAISQGGMDLRGTLPSLKIERSETMSTAEVIGTDVMKPQGEYLSPVSPRKPSAILRNFINQNTDLFGLTKAQVRLLVEGENDDRKGVRFARLSQLIDGVPVFQGEVSAALATDGRIARVINNLAAGLNYAELSRDFGDASDAVGHAERNLGHEKGIHTRNERKSTEDRVVFGEGDWATNASKVYFPIEIGTAVPAWQVVVWEKINAYLVVIDAATGTMLWRKNLTEEQTVGATYGVYGSSTNALFAADSPTPYTPGCDSPTCPQPSIIARSSFTGVGNEPPNAFNDLGWIPDTGLPVRSPPNPNITDGNNVESGIDRDGLTGIDPQGHAIGNPTRVFNSAYNPAPGNPSPGDSPTPPNPQTYPPTSFQQGVTSFGFYLVNRWHDQMYRYGFNEAARNFQHFNFGRGGIEGDRISMEIQDSSGTTGANFSAPPDGGRGRMQNFIWPGTGPVGRDAGLDATIVLHELTHGLTSRSYNSTGLGSNMAIGMGEGWSDFYAIALLSEPSDNQCGNFTVGGYATYLLLSGYTANHYYGLRRFPYSKIGCTGPNGLPHNPLTFRNLNAGNCSTFQSAYPRGPIGAAQCDQVHNAGEIWASTLWEMRGLLIDTHGPVEGNRRALQYTTDALRCSPPNPTFLQGRDALIACTGITSAGDAGVVREAFRRRGMGFSASITSTNPANVTEAFDYPSNTITNMFDFDGDGRTDISVYRPADGTWYMQQSGAGFKAQRWGNSTDKVMPADYDGDDKADLAVFRKSESSTWYILNSATSTVSILQWGATNPEQAIIFDTPVPADYDADGKADLAVWRTTDNPNELARFLIRQSSNGSLRNVQWGVSSDVPVPLGAPGRAEIAIYRPSNGQWWVRAESTGFSTVYQFGSPGDQLVPADYTGDGLTDLAVWRPSTGEWFVLRRHNATYFSFPFGTAGDKPVPGFYDTDGVVDAAVYRPSTGVWYVNKSLGGITVERFGTSSDVPMPNAYVR